MCLYYLTQIFTLNLILNLKKRKINVTFNKLEEIWKTWNKL